MPKKTADLQYYEAIGKRKSAVARVRLYKVAKGQSVSIGQVKAKSGEILVNQEPITAIFSSHWEKTKYLEPLQLTGCEDKFAISIIVRGGGKHSQLEALVHGLSRSLEKVDKETFRPVLKKGGFLKRDARVRERRKVGRGGKARRQKQSPKR